MFIYILAIIFFIILPAVTFLLYKKNANRVASASMPKPSNIISFKASCDIKSAMEIIINSTRSSSYRVEDIDSEKCIIVLSDESTYYNNGNIFPIYFSEEDDQVLIEIGIYNKGLRLDKAIFHNNCVSFIKSSFLLEQSNNMPNSDKTKYCTVCGKAYVHDKDKHFCDSCGQKL